MYRDTPAKLAFFSEVSYFLQVSQRFWRQGLALVNRRRYEVII